MAEINGFGVTELTAVVLQPSLDDSSLGEFDPIGPSQPACCPLDGDASTDLTVVAQR